jgi:Fe2+ or Zn2+ uptake regulation protein
VSGRIVGEVLDYAPESLSESERWVLVAIAEAARDSDRIARYETDVDTLARRSKRSPGTVRNALSSLTSKGLIKPLLAARRGLVQHYQVAKLEQHHRFITYNDVGSTHRPDKRRKVS